MWEREGRGSGSAVGRRPIGQIVLLAHCLIRRCTRPRTKRKAPTHSFIRGIVLRCLPLGVVLR